MISPRQGLLFKLDQLIDKHIDNPELSIDFICGELGISRSHLHRLLKDHAHLSISLYIRHRRLKKAQDLLQTTPLRIVEVAEQVGIANPQNFSKYFTEHFGTSPSEFRRTKGLAEKPATPQEGGKSETASVSTTEPLQLPFLTMAVEPGDMPHTVGRLFSNPGFRWRVAGLLLLVLGAAGWYRAALPTTTSEAALSDNSIAVLPFQNLGSAQMKYFSEGVVEQIQSSLTLVEKLRVISRTSTLPYSQTTKPVAQVGRELGVNYLLEGCVLQVGKRIRVSVELIQAPDNRVVWTNAYEGDRKAMFGFTSGVARQVARELNQKLSQVIRQRMDKAPTQNAEAYNEFLKGGYLMRTRTQEGLRGSLLNFDRAIALDSTFADAYADKALVYFLIATEGYEAPANNIKRAEKNALLAIRYDAENALAYAMLAKLYQFQNKWEEANTAYQIALKYRPNDALINYWYSLMLRSVGQLDQAIAYSTKAVNLDPLYPVILIGHISNLAYAGRFAEAQTAIAEGQRLHATLYSWYWAKGFYYLCRHQYPQAQAAFAKGQSLNPATTAFAVQVAYLKARMGQPRPARQLLDSLPNRVDIWPDKAILCAGLGDTNQCLTYLEKGSAAGMLPNYLKVSPMFSFLKTNPRFRAVLQKAGLDNPSFGKP